MSERETLSLAADGEVERTILALEDARARTMRFVDRMRDEHLERGEPNSVGSVLYHVAAIEADWLYDEILGDPGAIPATLFPHEVREENGRLTPITGMDLAEHRARLETVRASLLESLRALDPAGFHALRACPNYDVSPAYVAHHLMQHEAEHRAEIGHALLNG